MVSILTSIKADLGVCEDNDAHDSSIVGHINSAFADLHQLGVGPASGFSIEDETSTWDDFLGEAKAQLAFARRFVYLSAKLGWDPPASSAILDSMERQKKEVEWRLAEAAEE